MDVLFRFSFADLPIRGQWVRLQSSLQAAGQFRAYPPQVSHLLGQMLASVAMIADNLKFSGAVALQSQGNGALRRSLAECRDHTNLRGIMHLTDDASFPPSYQDIGAWLGAGQLAITLLPDEDTGMQPYQGLVALTKLIWPAVWKTTLSVPNNSIPVYFSRAVPSMNLMSGLRGYYCSGCPITLVLRTPNAMPPKMLGKHLPRWLQR